VHAGAVYPMFLARKQIGYPPYFEEVGHVVDATDPLLADETVRRVVRDAHRALGFTDGMTHTELMLTADGPRVIEVNGRLGGDLIPYLGLRASGIDPGLAAAAVACGLPPDVTPTRRLAGAVRFFYPDHDDTVIGSVDLDVSTLPSRPDRFVVLVEPGEVLSPPPKGTLFGRAAFATAIADRPRQCADTLEAVGSVLAIREAAPAGGGR
jgi:hypothetical protein